MSVANASTGAPLSAPPALRPLRGVSGLATDGSAIAFPNADYTALSWSRSLAKAPRRVFSTGDVARHVDNSVQVAGRYAVFSVGRHAYLADSVAGRFVQISPGGWGRLTPAGLVFLRPRAGKKLHTVADVVVLRRAEYPPIARCR